MSTEVPLAPAVEPGAASARSVAPQVTLILLAISFQALVSGGFGLVLPLIRTDLGLTFTQAGSLAAASAIVYAAMQVPAGLLADRYGAARLFAIGTVTTNVLAIALAVSGQYVAAIAVTAATGLTRALAFAPGLVLISSWLPPRRRATAMGLFMAGGSLWTVLFGAVAPAATATAGWRALLAAFGAIGLVFSIAFSVLGGVARPTSRSSGAASAARTVDLVRRPITWVLGYVQFTRLAVAQGVAIWLPTFLVDEHGLPFALAGGVVAATALATAPSNLAGGYGADRSGHPYLVIGASLAVLAVALTLLGIADAGLALVLAVLLIACFQQLYFGPLFAAPIDLYGEGSAGLVSGLGNLFANLGGFAAVFGFGVIKDATGSLAPGFFALAAMCLLAVVGTWRLQVAAVQRGT